MGSSARPETTSKGSATEPRYPGLPTTIPRILSPEEFEQAQFLTTPDLSRWNMPLTPPDATARIGTQEGKTSSTGAQIAGQVGAGLQATASAAAHPVETAKHIVRSVVDDLAQVFLAPVEGARNDPDPKTGLLPYPDLPVGAVVTKENTPNAITRHEMHKAAMNTAINAAFLGMPELAAPARIAANATLGAYYDPEQPFRGATAAALFGEGLNAVVKGAKPLARAAGPAVGKFLEEHPPGLSTQDVGPNAPRQAPGTEYTAPLDAGKDPRLVNVEKLGLSPEGEASLRSFLPAEGVKTKVTHAETEALAQELAMDPAKLATRIGDWSGAEALAARNVVSQSTERIVQLSRLTQDMTKPIAEREAAQSEISRLTTDVSTMAKRLSGERTKTGRDLNAFKIIANNTMDPAVWLAQAERVRGGLPLTAEHQTEIIRLTGENDRAGVINYVSKLARTTAMDKAIALWKAGLLTGLRTHEVNMASNVAMAGLETMKDIPAAAIDRVASLVTGERTVAPSFRGNIVEAARGVGKGLKSARSVLKNGDPGQLERWDFRQTNFNNPVAQFYVDAVFRSLSAEDQIARGAAMGRALEEHLRLRAKVNAKADPTHTPEEHLALLRQNPPDDVMVKAIADAEYAVFQNDNAISRGISAFKKQLPEGGRAAADVVLPFVKTPTNVALRMADYSPIGFFTTLAKQLKDPNQRALAQGLGRSVTGSALIWLGFTLASQGQATGAAPTSAGQRELQTMQGAGPNRVRMGGKWVDVSRLSPAGALVAVGAQMYHATKDAQGPSDALAGAGFSLGRVVLDQPMVSGLSSALDAAKDPQHAGGRFVSRLAGSVVPTAVADVASSMDPSQRDVKGVVGSIKARVPGARETLPEKLGAFGEPLPNQNQGVKAFVNALNVTNANDDALVQELSRLKVSLSEPGKKIKLGMGKNAIEYQRTDEEQRQLKADIGRESEERLRRILATDSYAQLSDDEKKARLERVINDVRTKVYAMERRKIRQDQQAAKATP